jgi:UDP-N-acetylmuramoyl-tripeptide--D-alanyl-D-alanine ligase
MRNIIEIYNQFLLSDGISTDSREDVNNKIFFALSGDNFNGNKFAYEAHKKGARLCVIDDSSYTTNDNILVPNVLVALQELAQYHRNKSTATVLAITGTNGKTTTKELISSVLTSHTNIVSTQGNFNNHIGVPLTLLKINPSTKIAIVEMGANNIGEINTLCNIAQPNLGIITNIGKAHLEGFGSFEGVVSTKNELFNYLKKNNGKVIVNNDDKLLKSLSLNIPQFTYGNSKANVTGKIIEHKPSLKIEWNTNNISYDCSSQLYGNYNFSNIMAAITTGIFFDVPSTKINKAIGNYFPKNNRSQKIVTNNNSIIMDAYNANPTSMNGAITSFVNYNFNNPYLILGDMFELGEYAIAEHQTIIDILTNNKVKNAILIGNDFIKTKNHNFQTFISTKEAMSYLDKNRIKNANILVKGSRGMKLEDLLMVL